MFGHNNLSLTLLLTTLVIPLFAIESKLTGTNACIGKLKCHECIRTPSCAWCSKPVRFYHFCDKCIQYIDINIFYRDSMIPDAFYPM